MKCQWFPFSSITALFRKFPSLFDQVLVSGGNFLTIVICARFFPLHEQGKLGYLYSVYLALVLLNLAAIFQRASVQASGEVDKDKFKYELVLLQLFIACFSCGILIIILPLFKSKFHWYDSTLELFFIVIYIFFQQAVDFQRRSKYIFSTALHSFYSSLTVYPLRLVILFLIAPRSLTTTLIVLIATTVLPGILFLYDVHKSFRDKVWARLDRLWVHLKESVNFVVLAPIGWLLAFIPVFALGLISGTASVAILTTIRSVANFTNIFLEQLETVVAVRFSSYASSDDKRNLDRETRSILLIGFIVWILITLLILLFGREILLLTLGATYQPYKNLLLLLWISLGVYSLARLYGVLERAKKDFNVELIGHAVAVFLMAIVSYPIIKKYDLLGAAVIYLVGFVIILITQIVYSKRSLINRNST